MFGRQKVATLVAEFLGTGILTLAYLSVQRTNIGIPFFVGIGAAIAVALAVYFFGGNSGVHLNPALTIAVATARKISVVMGALYIVCQLLGAWAAYGVYHYFVTSTLPQIGGHYNAHVLFAEAVGALILALAWGAAYFRNFETGHRAFVMGAGYGLAIIFAGAVSTNYGVANPAVALGIRAWDIWGSMGWGTYVLGPVLGAVIGVNLYSLLFAPTDKVGGAKAVVAEAGASASSSSTTRSTRSSAKKTSTRKTAAKKTTTTRRRR